MVSLSTSVPSLPQATSTTTSASLPSTPSRKSIPSDPKELVAFLLRDDKTITSDKTKEILKKLTSTAKLLGEKRESVVQLAGKSCATTGGVVAKQLTKLHTAKPLMVAKSAKPHSPVTVGVVQSVTSKPNIVSSVAAVPTNKSVQPKSSPSKVAGVTLSASKTSPNAMRPSGIKTGSGLTGLQPRVTIPKVEKRKEKKKKLSKDALSLSTALPSMVNATLKAASGSNPPHMLATTTTELLQYFTSGNSAPLIKLITKAAGSSRAAQPTAAAPTVITTTSNGSLLLAAPGTSHPQLSLTQADLAPGKSAPKLSSQVTKSGKVVDGVAGLSKSGRSVDSQSVVSKALSSSLKPQLKTTPVIQMPRTFQPVVSSDVAAVSVTRSTAPPPLATIISTELTAPTEEASLPHTHSAQTTAAVSSHTLKQLKPATVSTIVQQQQNVHKKVGVVSSNSQQTMLKSAASVPVVHPPAKAVVPLVGGVTVAQVISHVASDSFSIPPLPKLIASSKPLRHPLVQQLPLAADARAVTTVSKDVPPLTSASVIETPPHSTSPWKESSPLKSPVEQIMEEHSYLGSSHSSPLALPGQSPWQQLQLVHPSSSQQLHQSEEQNAIQTQQIPKGHNVYPKE